MLKNIIFDMGGVLVTIDHERAVKRFTDIGIKEASRLLDPYTQGGPFGKLECGDISAEEFILEMSHLAGRSLTYEECAYGWLGYAKDVPERNLDMLESLRRKGYRLILLSNMNPFVNAWLEGEPLPLESLDPSQLGTLSSPFAKDTDGRPLSSYFDSCYRSFEIRMMKPDPRVFSLILDKEGIIPDETLLVDDGPRNCAAARDMGLHTLQPENGRDWTQMLARYLAADTEG